MKNIEKLFDEYVNEYDLTDPKIKLKYNHSYRVMKLSEMIARKLCLNKEEIGLAKTIGLIHDIGRFEQLKRYNDFSDKDTIDHALLGCEILENGEIKKYANKDNYATIITAIKNHNKYEIKNVSDYYLLQAMIIRDADKLDILYLTVFTDKTMKESNDMITDKVRNDFFSNKLIDYSDVRNDNDRIICDLAMMYDLNFECSYDYILNNGFINAYYNKLKNKKLFKEYFTYMQDFIEERKKKYAR